MRKPTKTKKNEKTYKNKEKCQELKSFKTKFALYLKMKKNISIQILFFKHYFSNIRIQMEVF